MSFYFLFGGLQQPLWLIHVTYDSLKNMRMVNAIHCVPGAQVTRYSYNQLILVIWSYVLHQSN